jgi:hypothetical protein
LYPIRRAKAIRTNSPGPSLAKDSVRKEAAVHQQKGQGIAEAIFLIGPE